MKCDMLRAYVRLYKTPPAKVRMDNSAQEQAKLLLFVLIQRHWAMHGESLSALFKAMPGTLPVHMSRQVQGMLSERDGMRKAIMLHSILKGLIGHRMDRIITQLSLSSSSSLTRPSNSSLVQEDFEQSLQQLTSAAKILYGSPAILVDDVLSRSPQPSDENPNEVKRRQSSSNLASGMSPRFTPRGSPRPPGPSSLSIKEAQRQQDLTVIKLFNLLKQKMPELSRSYLSDHPTLIRRSMVRAVTMAKAAAAGNDALLSSPEPTMASPAAGSIAAAEGPDGEGTDFMQLGRSVSFAALYPTPGLMLDEEELTIVGPEQT